MPTSYETRLTQSEVREYLSALEKEYGFSSSDFLTNSEMRGKVSEDDGFRWQAYIDHFLELQRIDEEIRGSYLSKLSRRASRKEARAETTECLAA